MREEGRKRKERKEKEEEEEEEDNPNTQKVQKLRTKEPANFRGNPLCRATKRLLNNS